ncbi:MAG: Na(+)/H(+) antiporter subunit C [Bacillota bacterium]|nr:MAG: Na(+)/H(+) antiporter subunit C [Bacillota bacterium]
MELLTAIGIGVLFAAGTYLLLSRNVVRVVLGNSLLAYGTNLMLLASGGLGRGAAPVLVEGVEVYTDPVPQALILTAIVINFGVTAFLLVLAYRMVQEHRSEDLAHLRGVDDE